MTWKSPRIHTFNPVSFIVAVFFASTNLAAACEQYLITSVDQVEPVKSAITSLENDSVFDPATDFPALQVGTVKTYEVNRKFQQAWVSQRIEYEFCLTLQNNGVTDTETDAKLENLRSLIYEPQGFTPIHSTVMDDTPIKLAAMGPQRGILSTPVQFSETRFLWQAPYVLTNGNKHFVIVASVLDGNAAIAQANRMKRNHPDLDFAVYAPYLGNPYHGIMMASWVDASTAREARKIARKSIARDAYIWSCKSEGRFC